MELNPRFAKRKIGRPKKLSPVRFLWNQLLFLVLAVIFIGGAQSNERLSLQNNLQAELDHLAEVIKLPGANLSIILPDGDILALSSGYADRELNIPMKPSNKMLSGSIGKTYVAAIAFQLIQENKLELSDKVIDLLKDEKWINQISNINELTVEMLLAHTSGLPRYEYFDDVWKSIKANPDRVWSVYDRMKYIFNAKPLHPAGKGWAYSDSNFILLGSIIEKITGLDYYDCFKSLISGLSDLKNTVPSDRRHIKGLASGYSGFLTKYGFPEKVAENETVSFNPQMEWCGGGVASTATDLAFWAKSLYEDKVISPESVKKMVTPSDFNTDLPDGAKYGHGAIIDTCDSVLYYGHQGFFPGYLSIVQYSPDYRFSIGFQLNRDNPSTNLSLNQLIKPFRELVILHLNSSKN
jgi:D-alanyl-D-alanine carboxypeptidase